MIQTLKLNLPGLGPWHLPREGNFPSGDSPTILQRCLSPLQGIFW